MISTLSVAVLSNDEEEVPEEKKIIFYAAAELMVRYLSRS